jgi:hypothetical protein
VSQKSQKVRHILLVFFLADININRWFDDETPIASGSGTYQHKTWNALENSNGNEDWEAFFAGIYKQSRSTRLNVADSHDLYQERKNFLSGVLDVGYVITQKVKKKRFSAVY